MAIHWSNIAWGDFPNWLMALATIGALVAASLAAKWTFRTVKAAEKQVVAAQAQVETAREQAGAAREQLSLARAEVEREHEVAKAAEDRFLRAQLDGRMPVVYARATPGCDLQEYVSTVASQSFGRPALTAVAEEKWNAARDTLTSPSSEVGQPLTVSESERYVFAMTVTIEFVNCSDVPARIDITESSNAELNLRQGQDLVIPPRESRHVVWTRRLSSQQLATQEEINRADVSFLQLEYWVRDIGQNVRDTYRCNLDMRYFERDGTRLIVKPRPPFPWREAFASQWSSRLYERLDATANVRKAVG